MNNKYLSIILISILALIPTATFVKATNEGSYIYGKWEGSLTGPLYAAPGGDWYPEFDNNTCALKRADTLTYPKVVTIPAVTNTTSCQDGWYDGYKQWCNSHALYCVQNITSGIFPPMILQAKEQYDAGAKAANGSGNSMCPIGNNAAFCQGWDSNNDDYGNSDCADEPLANITTPLMGCIGDSIPANQIGGNGLPDLVGNWNFVNESSTKALELGITGTMLFNNNGYMKMTVPSKTGFGDYALESSWAYIGTKHHILTICYAGGCENSTLTIIMPNHIEFTDNNNDTIHLMRFHPSTTTTAIPQPPQTNVTILYQNGQDQANLQNYTGALAIYQKALSIDPNNEKVLADMGRILYNLQNYTGALSVLNKAININSTDAYALEQKGSLLYKLGDYDQVLVTLNKALELDPHNTQTMDTKGSALIQLGDYPEAISVFNVAIAVDKYDSNAYYDKALALEDIGLQTHAIGDIGMAIQTLDKTLFIYADNKEAQSLKISLEDLLTWSQGEGQGQTGPRTNNTIVKRLVPAPTLTPDPNESAAYNAGFTQGYEGIPLKHHHTHDFLTGYKNGISSYLFNRGEVEVENGMSPTSKNPDYIQGFQQGKAILADGGSIEHTLPMHTADNYTDFYIGYHNGAAAADSDNSKDNLGYHGCPSGHTKEFCDGYSAGYGEQGYLLHDA
jgi:tetratricopeptide (TPR) repeat protein